MKKKMRVMAMILAAALCVSSTPFSVSADEMETEVTEASETLEDLDDIGNSDSTFGEEESVEDIDYNYEEETNSISDADDVVLIEGEPDNNLESAGESISDESDSENDTKQAYFSVITETDLPVKDITDKCLLRGAELEEGIISFTTQGFAGGFARYEEEMLSTEKGFRVSFDYRCDINDSGADGIEVLFETSKGIFGTSIDNSYGVDFNTFYSLTSPHEIETPHVGICDADFKHIKSGEYSGLWDSAWHNIVVDYQNSVLSIYVDDYEVLSLDNIDLPEKIYPTIKTTEGLNEKKRYIKNVRLYYDFVQPTQEKISNVLKYDPKTNAYGFKNDDEIFTYFDYRKFFNPLKAYLLSSEMQKVGCCYGLTITSIASSILSSPSAASYGAENVYGIGYRDYSTETRENTRNYIKYAQISQMTENAQKLKNEASDDLDAFYNAVINMIKSENEIITLAIRGDYYGNTGHRLWVIGIGENTSELAEIYVYDSNYPGEVCSLWLAKENEKCVSWEYTLWSGCTWGTGKKYSDFRFYNPVKQFTEEFGKKVGYKPAIEQGTSKGLLNINNASSSITINGVNYGLRPDKRIEGVDYISIDSAIPNSTNNNGGLYWIDEGNIVVSSDNEDTSVHYATEEYGLMADVPKSATINLDTDKSFIGLFMSEPGEYSVKMSINEDDEDIRTIQLKGMDSESAYITELSSGDIKVGAENLKNVTITETEIKADGKENVIHEETFSTSDKSVVIKENGSISYTEKGQNNPSSGSDGSQNPGTDTGSTVTTKSAASGSTSTTISAPAASKLKKVKAGKKKATLKWKKVSGATGYEIQYGTKKNFKKAKTKTIKKAKTVKTSIKKLKAGKKYYFRIRTYKTVNGKKYYSAWSKAKKVKIK